MPLLADRGRTYWQAVPRALRTGHDGGDHGQQPAVDLQRPAVLTGAVSVDHLMELDTDDMPDHADEPRRADREPGQVEVVVAGIPDQIGRRHHAGRAEQVALGVLDGDDPRVVGELDERVVLDRHPGCRCDKTLAGPDGVVERGDAATSRSRARRVEVVGDDGRNGHSRKTHARNPVKLSAPTGWPLAPSI